MTTEERKVEQASSWTKAGACLSAAALVISLMPAPALADNSSSDNQNQQTSEQSTDQSGSQNSNQGNGQADQNSNQSGTPPEKPSGDDSDQNGNPPEKPDGDNSQAPQGNPPDGNGGGNGGGANTQSYDYSGTYSGAKTVDGTEESVSSEEVSATDTDQNALLVQNGGTATVTGASIAKSGDSDNADNCNFYGTNSGVLAAGEKSKAYVSESAIATSAAGANGIFATDSATVYASDVSIKTTSKDGNSRALDATYGGTIVANKVSASTAGDHCATVATDRGGGNVSLTNSTLETSGSGSPLLYSTGDIEVDNVSGTASGSQIAGMEGLNSILVSNSSLESTNNAISGSDPVKNGVIIYQSTSGDADTSTGDAANFTASNSTLKTNIDEGSMFYLTNTTANVVLSNSTLDFDSSKVKLLQAEGNDANGWGTASKNGAKVNFTLTNQSASGDVSADDISTAKVYVLNKSTWTGAASITENSASDKSTSKTPLTINVDSTSTWTVTGNSTVSKLNVAKGGKVVDSDGKTVSIVANGKTVVKGDSDYTVTVTGSYSTKVKTSDANEVASANINRSDFDSYYSTTTTFNKNSSSEQGSSVDVSAAVALAEQASSNPVVTFFQNLLATITGGK
ncbi:MAG: adhesin [Coriobacteriia bacterium]|nr:adhesin [Coriobacteriia bacterium]